MNYVVAVPSYQRYITTNQRTLATLQRGGVDPRTIMVLVANEEERAQYASTLDPTRYGSLVITKPRLGPSRNNAAQILFKPGQPVLWCDDDIDDLKMRVSDKKLRSFYDGELDEFVKEAFDLAQNAKRRLWGIYAVDNPYFMRDTVASNYCYINGTFWGTFNTPEVLIEGTDTKEDWERTIKFYLLDGGVFRFNNVCTKTTYYGAGGLAEYRAANPGEELAACKDLVRRFPLLCELNLGKASGHAEVRLRDRRVHPNGVAFSGEVSGK